MATIAIDNVAKAFGNVQVLHDIELAIADGEFLVLVGPSGCGKSTLLRILAGLDTQSGGTIKIEAPGWAVQNAMVFQESGLFPWMNVETNVGFGLMTRGVPAGEAAERVDAALKLVGLSKFRKHYPHQLSGGMRQRSAIARAFVTDPGMLLMDEPFAALDVQTRARMQDFLLDVWRDSGASVLFVTHHIDEAVALADRVVVFTSRPGRIKTIVPVELPRPRHLFSREAEALRLQLTELLRDEVDRAFAEQEALAV